MLNAEFYPNVLCCRHRGAREGEDRNGGQDVAGVIAAASLAADEIKPGLCRGELSVTGREVALRALCALMELHAGRFTIRRFVIPPPMASPVEALLPIPTLSVKLDAHFTLRSSTFSRLLPCWAAIAAGTNALSSASTVTTKTNVRYQSTPQEFGVRWATRRWRRSWR